jgi:Na+-translocating ferredoxin:NAD+ oxidoreductase RnfC subunit
MIKNYPLKHKLKKSKACEEYVFPLSQHIGAPSNPVVKKGDEVCAGTLTC